MKTIKSVFSIKDLENLTGIKAHTIRMWEKRYDLLEPERSKTNIRSYNLRNMQKLLNINFLNTNGFKISKIAALDENEITTKVRELSISENIEHHSFNAFKLSMLNFNHQLFYKTYNQLLEEKSFRQIFNEILHPFIINIGMLWQTQTISSAHERFITSHIRQKILIHIERLQSIDPRPRTKTFVLFLPVNEVNDLGLLYINYELLSKGYHTIYLGENIPTENLKQLNNLYKDITYISYLTEMPSMKNISTYLDDIYETSLKGTSNTMLITGKRIKDLNVENLPEKMTVYKSLDNLVKDL
ncbi:MAG: MerR family transcriptional regulator [Flavobacteriaceae bacterium]|jgi:DNA-binding transcriptional MerR regulator|tara:strand:+ start:122 stop:1021 length:900 start_codon:yes stop_codon:yes gene_type:complete